MKYVCPLLLVHYSHLWMYFWKIELLLFSHWNTRGGDCKYKKKHSRIPVVFIDGVDIQVKLWWKAMWGLTLAINDLFCVWITNHDTCDWTRKKPTTCTYSYHITYYFGSRKLRQNAFQIHLTRKNRWMICRINILRSILCLQFSWNSTTYQIHQTFPLPKNYTIWQYP